MDILSFFRSDQRFALAVSLGCSVGAIAGLLKDKDDLAKTYINLCQGIVYGGLSGPIIYNNEMVQLAIVLTVCGYAIHSIDDIFDIYSYKHHKNHKRHNHIGHKKDNHGAFFDHH